MLKAMEIGKKDLSFNFGLEGHLDSAADSLFNHLQEYFERPENKLNIYFDTENIAKNLKSDLDANGVSVSGGGGDVTGLVSELYSLLRGQKPADYVIPDSSPKQEESIIPDNLDEETEEAIETGKEYVKVLDETTIHIDKVIESLKAFANVANKKNASKGSKAIAQYLSDRGIDVTNIKDNTPPTEIKKMLQESWMTKDKMGKPLGATIAETLKNMRANLGMDAEKGAGKVVEHLIADIKELFNINDIETEFIQEMENRFKQLNAWQGVEKPGRALAALGKVRNTKKQKKTPSLEDIDQAIHYFEVAGESTDALKRLREARVTLGDSDTDEAKQAFEQETNAFYEETKVVFNRLRTKWLDFRGVVQAEGRKPVTIDPRGAYPTRILEIPEDAKIISVLPFKGMADTVGSEGFNGSSARRESSWRKAEQQARRFAREGSGYDFVGDKPHAKKDIKAEEIEYKKFKTQEEQKLPRGVALGAELASLKEHAAEVPKLIEKINEGRAVVADLENTKKQLIDDIARMQVEDLPEVKTGALTTFDNRRTQVAGIVESAKSALKTNTSVDFGNTSKLGAEQSTLASRLQAVVNHIHKDSIASQELADKIAEIVEAKKLSHTELDALRAEANNAGNIERANFYRDLMFDKPAVNGRLAGYRSQKDKVDFNLRSNKNVVQDLIKELEEANKTNIAQATQEATALVTQLNEIKNKLYAEAQLYAKILENPDTDESTRQATLGKMQQTLRKLNSVNRTFADIPAEGLGRPNTLLDDRQQKKLDKWNTAYTNKDVRKLEDKLRGLEEELKKEEDEAKIVELKKKIANVKRALTNRKKNTPENVTGKTRSQLTEVERKLTEAQSQLSKDETQLKLAEGAKADYDKMSGDAQFLEKYNALLAKEKALLEEINRLKKEGADEEAVAKKYRALGKATKELDNFLKENKTTERTAYAREEAVKYAAQLKLAKRQRSAFNRQIEDLEKEENSITQYGLRGQVGARALRRTKTHATHEFMTSDYVKSLEEQLRNKVLETITEAENKSRAIFDGKVTNAMERLGWNPQDQMQVQKFLKTSHGRQLSADFASEVDANTRSLWAQYNEYIEDLRAKLRKDFEDKFSLQDGVLSTAFKAQDADGKWVDEVKSYDVKKTALSRIAAEKEIAETNRKPLDDIIKDLAEQRDTALRYGVVDYEDLANDGRLKEIDRLNDQIADRQQKLNDKQKELADIQSDDTIDDKTKSKLAKAKQKQIDGLNQEIADLEAKVGNRTELIARKHQEKEDSKLTLEQNADKATERVVQLKERLVKAEERIVQLRAEYEASKGTENEIRALEKLNNQIDYTEELKEKIQKAEEKETKLKEFVKKKAERAAKKAEKATSDDEVLDDNITPSDTRTGYSGVEIDVSGLATEDTLRAIYELLGGGDTPSDVIDDDSNEPGVGRNKKDLSELDDKALIAKFRRLNAIEGELSSKDAEELHKVLELLTERGVYKPTRKETVEENLSPEIETPTSYADIQKLVRQYVEASVSALTADNVAQGIKNSVDIEMAIAEKLQSAIGDRFNVDDLLDDVALGGKSEKVVVDKIAEVYGFKKSSKKKQGLSEAEINSLRDEYAGLGDDKVLAQRSEALKEFAKLETLYAEKLKNANATTKEAIRTKVAKEFNADEKLRMTTSGAERKALDSRQSGRIAFLNNYFPDREVAGWQGLTGAVGMMRDEQAKINAALAQAKERRFQIEEIFKKQGIPITPVVQSGEVSEVVEADAKKDAPQVPIEVADNKTKKKKKTTPVKKTEKIKVPVEPEMKPAAVAEEVKENVAEVPAEVPVEPVAEKKSTKKKSTKKKKKTETPKATGASSDEELSEEELSAIMEAISGIAGKVEAMSARVSGLEDGATDGSDDAVPSPKINATNTSGGGILGVMRSLATESTLQKVLSALGDIAKKNANSGKANSAQDLLERFRRMLESDAWEGRERVAYLDLETGAISNSITGDEESISAERLKVLRDAYKNVMNLDAQVHTHADEDDPYFSDTDIQQFASDFANGITKQILLSKNNMTVLDMSAVKDVNGLLDALTQTEHNFEALATTADKFGAKYINKAFNEITPQGLVKMLGIKGIESKYTEAETRDSAVKGMLEEDAKVASDMLQESTGRAVKKTVERVGAELMTTTEKTDAKGNKTWSKQISDKYTKAALATNKAFTSLGLDNEFGIGTEAQIALTEYQSKFQDFLHLVEEFKKNPEQDGLQDLFNVLLPQLDAAEDKLNKLIVRKDKFTEGKDIIATFSQNQLGDAKTNLHNLAVSKYHGQNIAFNGLRGTNNGTELLVDVLHDGVITQYALEVDKATGQVRELMVAENALANAFQNVNKAMKQNEVVQANVAVGDTPTQQARFMRGASSPEWNAYKKELAHMEKYVANAWAKIQKNIASGSGRTTFTQKQLDYIMTLSEKVMALGREVQSTSAQFKNFWEQHPEDVTALGINIKKGENVPSRDEQVRAAMEKFAQTNAGASGSQYKFTSFDNDTLKYQLTDIEGNVRNMTLVWSELYGQIANVSDKSVAKLDPLVAKVQKYEEAIQNALSLNYLDSKDPVLKAFQQQQEVVKQTIEDVRAGTKTYEDLERARQKAVDLGANVNKQISQNKKSYVGTKEINSVNRQRDRIIGTLGADVFEESDVAYVQAYKTAYEQLIATHKQFADNNTLYSAKNQEELRQQAVGVQNLGKQLLSSINQAEKLQQLVDQSGVYRDRRGYQQDLGGVSAPLTAQEADAKNLQETMRSYVANTLKQGNIENVKFNASTQQLTYTFRTSKDTVADMVVQYNAATNALYAYNKQERESVTGFAGFFKGIKGKLASLWQYTMGITSIHRVLSELRRGVQYIREIDQALVELRKVTDETEATYDKFLKTASRTASEIGSTISSLTQATATFAKLGYDMSTASEMAKAAVVYQNVGDGIESADAAAESIISTMKGFGLQASESMRIVDRFNQVGNEFSITSKGIGDALQRSASALSEGGNSLDESIGLITAANSVVQDPESVGKRLCRR